MNTPIAAALIVGSEPDYYAIDERRGDGDAA